MEGREERERDEQLYFTSCSQQPGKQGQKRNNNVFLISH